MKAKLEFNLNDAEDRIAHLRAVKSLDMALALWEIQHNLKKKCEHLIDSMDSNADVYDGLYVAFDAIFELLDEHDIDTEKLVE